MTRHQAEVCESITTTTAAAASHVYFLHCVSGKKHVTTSLTMIA